MKTTRNKRSCWHGNVTVKIFSCYLKISNFDNRVGFPAPHSKLFGETSAGMNLWQHIIFSGWAKPYVYTIQQQ